MRISDWSSDVCSSDLSFVHPGLGVIWKMKEDLSEPYPGYGLGAMDAFDGYVSYRLLGEEALAAEIAEMKRLIDEHYEDLRIDQALGPGMMLGPAHFFPPEEGAKVHHPRARQTSDEGTGGTARVEHG